jgi:ribosomal protein L14E/L6E/L27E
MNEIKAGDVVRSVAGHDKGGLFVVLDAVDADFVLYADGKTRTVEKPKKKKRKHLRAVPVNPMQITPNALPINAEIRRFLKAGEENL